MWALSCYRPHGDGGLNLHDNNFPVLDACYTLFAQISTWEPEACRGLSLDISVFSSSDIEHCFPYLTLEPDLLLEKSLLPYFALNEIPAILASVSGMEDPGMYDVSECLDIDFWEILTADLSHDWWREQPAISVVSSLLLRQQTRRRWESYNLDEMLGRFTGLKELYFEPWR